MGKWSTYRRRGSARDLSIVSGYASRVAAAGGSVSSATLAALNTLVTSMQDAGLWDLMFDVWPCCGTGLAAAFVKLKVAAGTVGSYTNTNFVAGNYNESGGSGGLQGDGATKALSGGCTMTQLALNCHLSVSALSVTAAAGNRSYCGVINGGDQYWLGGVTATTTSDVRLGLTATASLASAIAAGQWTASRLTSSDLKQFKDGAQVATSATVVTAGVSAQQVVLFGFNSGGAPSAFMNARLAFHTSGYGLTAAQAASLSTIIAAFNATLGR